MYVTICKFTVKNKKEIIKTFHHISISTSTKTRNTEVLSDDNHKISKKVLFTVDFYALPLDESYEITDIAQLIIYVMVP